MQPFGSRPPDTAQVVLLIFGELKGRCRENPFWGRLREGEKEKVC